MNMDYKPAHSPEEYKKLAEVIVPLTEVIPDENTKVIENPTEALKRKKMEFVKENFKEVYDLLEAVKNRTGYNAGWSDFAPWGISFVLVQESIKLQRVLGQILNQLETNNSEMQSRLDSLLFYFEEKSETPDEPPMKDVVDITDEKEMQQANNSLGKKKK